MPFALSRGPARKNLFLVNVVEAKRKAFFFKPKKVSDMAKSLAGARKP